MVQSTLGFSIDLKRIRAEINYINSEFQNLRTFIVPDVKTDRKDLFFFAMFPADGSLSVNDTPLVGKMFFPRSYPKYPPCLHLFNKTGRYNVDVFWKGEQSDQPSSSMCFDILGRKGEEPYGIWSDEMHLAAIFASLLQAIVSFKVLQKGSEYEREEIVSMQKMVEQHKSSEDIWKRYKKIFHNCPAIVKTPARRIEVHRPIMFQKNILPISFTQGKRTYTSTGFRLNSADFCVQIDLRDFRKFKHREHKYNFVISFILSNSQTDIVGHNPQTILVRNGITGTAAKKLKHQETIWFYHGQPLIDYSVINFTVSHNQVTMVVEKEQSSNSDDLNIHGDTVLSYLSTAEIGSVDSSGIFYLNIFVETKNTLQLGLGQPAVPEPGKTPKLTEQILDEKDFGIYVNTKVKHGFIHPGTKQSASDDVEGALSEKVDNRQVESLVIELGKLKDGVFALNVENFDYFKSLFESNKIATKDSSAPDKSQKCVRLNSNQAFYFRNLLNTFERKFRKEIVLMRAAKEEQMRQQKENSIKRSTGQQKENLIKRTVLVATKPLPTQPLIKSTQNSNGISPAEFWSKLKLSDSPLTSASPAKANSVQVLSESNRVQKDQESLENLAAAILDVPEEPPKLLYPESYLQTVTFVGIDLGPNTLNIYQDALNIEESSHLISQYERFVNPGHVTMGYYKDFFMRKDFTSFLQGFKENEIVLLNVVGYICDDSALALLIEIDPAHFLHSSLPVYPPNRNIHATVATNNDVSPYYSNKLIDFYIQNAQNPSKLKQANVYLKLFDKPFSCIGAIKFYFPRF